MNYCKKYNITSTVFQKMNKYTLFVYKYFRFIKIFQVKTALSILSDLQKKT